MLAIAYSHLPAEMAHSKITSDVPDQTSMHFSEGPFSLDLLKLWVLPTSPHPLDSLSPFGLRAQAQGFFPMRLITVLSFQTLLSVSSKFTLWVSVPSLPSQRQYLVSHFHFVLWRELNSTYHFHSSFHLKRDLSKCLSCTYSLIK